MFSVTGIGDILLCGHEREMKMLSDQIWIPDALWQMKVNVAVVLSEEEYNIRDYDMMICVQNEFDRSDEDRKNNHLIQVSVETRQLTYSLGW